MWNLKSKQIKLELTDTEKRLVVPEVGRVDKMGGGQSIQTSVIK